MSKHPTGPPRATLCRGADSGAHRIAVKSPAADERRGQSAQAKPIRVTSGSPHSVQQIIVPTDFSPADITLIRRAIRLGDIIETKVTVLHVLDINDPRRTNYCGCAADFMRQLKTDAEQQMQELMDHLAEEGIQAESLTVEGLPARQILAVLQQASLLVLRKPIAKPFWRLFSKRTAQQVLEEATCSLMFCPS